MKPIATLVIRPWECGKADTYSIYVDSKRVWLTSAPRTAEGIQGARERLRAWNQGRYRIVCSSESEAA